MKIIRFLGYQDSGKTSVIVALTRALTAQGKKVGTLKHIHDPEFTVDTAKKDTWRHSRAGASVVVGVAPRELAVIRRAETKGVGIGELLKIFTQNEIDYVLVEGFNRTFRGVRAKSVLCARNEEDAKTLLKEHPDALCVVSTDTWTKHSRGAAARVPVFRLSGGLQRLLKLVE